VNPNLAKLQPYPFEKLRLLFKDIAPDPRYAAINLGIGEPKHPTPEFIRQALAQSLSGLTSYPATAGTPEVREAIATWARRRYGLATLDALTQVLPVSGSRAPTVSLVRTETIRTKNTVMIKANTAWACFCPRSPIAHRRFFGRAKSGLCSNG
jgi:N-succinyldiaminopimelate aminotransferase